MSFPVCAGMSESGSPAVPGLTRAAVVAAMADGPDAVLALIAGVMAPLVERVRVLEAERVKDSHNSGKPPSTDATRTGRAPRSLRGKRGKAPGGQPGHPGRTLALRAVPDAVAPHAPAACGGCGAAFAADAPASRVVGERRQVVELPPVALACTEHRVAERACAGGGATTRGAYPAAGRSTVQYGPGVLALSVYLTAQHPLPVARAAEVLGALVGQRVSPATLVAAETPPALAPAPVRSRGP